MEDWSRLADYVVAGRVRLGYPDRRAFVAHLRDLGIDLTERTLGTLESGRRVGPSTLAAVQIGLGWTPGSPREVLAGGEPTTAGPPGGDPAPEQPEIPPEVVRETCEDWEWEIWTRLHLLTPDEKYVAIGAVQGARRRASTRATESADSGSRNRRHTA